MPSRSPQVGPPRRRDCNQLSNQYRAPCTTRPSQRGRFLYAQCGGFGGARGALFARPRVRDFARFRCSFALCALRCFALLLRVPSAAHHYAALHSDRRDHARRRSLTHDRWLATRDREVWLIGSLRCPGTWQPRCLGRWTRPGSRWPPATSPMGCRKSRRCSPGCRRSPSSG